MIITAPDVISLPFPSGCSHTFLGALWLRCWYTTKTVGLPSRAGSTFQWLTRARYEHICSMPNDVHGISRKRITQEIRNNPRRWHQGQERLCRKAESTPRPQVASYIPRILGMSTTSMMSAQACASMECSIPKRRYNVPNTIPGMAFNRTVRTITIIVNGTIAPIAGR